MLRAVTAIVILILNVRCTLVLRLKAAESFLETSQCT